MRLGAWIATVDVLFLVVGAEMSRRLSQGLPGPSEGRSVVTAWVAALTLVVLIPAVSVAAVSNRGPGPTWGVVALAGAGVIVGSVLWSILGTAFGLTAGKDVAPLALWAWRTAGYWALVFAAVVSCFGAFEKAKGAP